MFYHPVLVWKACYTSFAAVLFKPTSRTELNVSIRSPSSEGGEILIPHQSPLTQPVSISSPSSEGGESYYVGFFCSPRGVSISSPSSEGGENSVCLNPWMNGFKVSISSPSSEGGECLYLKKCPK